jgi:predicted PurR-regulated permease PerM
MAAVRSRGPPILTGRPAVDRGSREVTVSLRGWVVFWSVGLGGAAALFLLWQVVQPLLVVGAGILFGVLLDACVRGIRWLVPIGRAFALALTCALFAALAAGAFAWGGYQVAVQADGLIKTVAAVLDDWRSELTLLGIGGEAEVGADDAPTATEETGSESMARFLVPDPENLVERASTIFRTTFGAIGDLAVIVLVAVFTAANPSAYRDGLMSLAPKEGRPRFAEVLDETGAMLRWWLVGRLLAMTAVGTATWLLLTAIGMPSALLLGLQAGILTFVPFVGPVIGGVAILLVAMSQGGTMVLWAMGGYVVIQLLEGYLMTPLVEQKTVALRPILAITAMIVFGTLFGLLGIALATPLVAVIRLLVLRLYVDDALGGAVETAPADAD